MFRRPAAGRRRSARRTGYYALLSEQRECGAVVIRCLRTVFGKNMQRDIERGLNGDLKVPFRRRLQTVVGEKRLCDRLAISRSAPTRWSI